mgnify:CR=1 FL=1
MKYLQDKLAGFSTIQVLGWGASIIIAAGGFIWSAIGATNGDLKETRIEQTALLGRTITLEANYGSIKEDIGEVKEGFKEIKGELTEIKNLLKR